MSSSKSGNWQAAHKPDCGCPPCKSRRRQTEAILGATGKPREEVEALSRTRRKNIIDKITSPIVNTLTENDPHAFVKQWTLLRILEPNITVKQAAKRMEITDRTLYRAIKQGIKEGWFAFDDPMDKLEHEVIPKLIENINEFVDKKDKFVTMETAKATIFKVYQAAHGASDAPVTMLALKIENASPDEGKVFTGVVVGKPNVEE